MTKNSMYLLMNKIMTKYFIWPDLNNCKVVDKIFVCRFKEIIHNCDTDPTCVTELLKNSVTKPPQCDTYISEFKTKILSQKIKIKSSGKLNLKSGCIAYTSKVPVDLCLMNDSCCNVVNFSNQAYPKPIHFDEIKNIEFN
ncbi:Uncharacterized protein FWK35_00030340 [Aphis craccivora]|uniref:Uncharacterized protein n=1 Tax=Aphis craccivora TaxID=307492 RepID=A0A6G0VQK0_APHCR|nr:Uncharacterized protein FWK35_00030340 [Aphis craccivora]